MKALYRGKLYLLGDNLNVAELIDMDTGAKMLVSYGDPDLIVDPTDSDVENTPRHYSDGEGFDVWQG